MRDGDQVALVDLTDGDHLASYAGTDAAPVLTSATAIFPLAGGGLAVVDAQTGTERATGRGTAGLLVVANPDGSAIVGLGAGGGERLRSCDHPVVDDRRSARGGATGRRRRHLDADAVSRAVLSADGGSLLLVTAPARRSSTPRPAPSAPATPGPRA